MTKEPNNDQSKYYLLDKINTPNDLRKLDHSQLEQISSEVRRKMIEAVSITGGHLGAGLGVVELTVALHYVFNTPDDRLVWDVGHQSYPHKILTERKDKIQTIRQKNGLSGFTRREESKYDPFGAAHAGTSISAALGMAVASNLDSRNNKIIAVIGDGAMTAGMAYEAMNNAGAMNKPLIVILNDNDMSIARPVGAMSAYLARLISSRSYRGLRAAASDVVKKFPKKIANTARKAEEYARGIMTGGTLFEELGFYNIGPKDGHNNKHLLPILKNVRDNSNKKGPVLLHVVTKKGYGYAPAEASKDKYHGVGKFDVVTGKQQRSNIEKPTFTEVFSNSLIIEASKDHKICAVTAAMPNGTGLDKFEKLFPERMFDVGIAEQHAVTFAAGLATEGYKPFVAIYSTFLQRAYDQVVHDVAIQNLPVRFAIDRAGYVGADGPTHAGSFDIVYLASLPNFIVMAAADESELNNMVATCASIDNCPSAVRYPRGTGIGNIPSKDGKPIKIGKGRIIIEGTKVAILSLGSRLHTCLNAVKELESMGLSTTLADARFCKPIDEELIIKLAKNHQVLLTVEEGSIGGFASHVLKTLLDNSLLESELIYRNIFFPDKFIEQDSPNGMYKTAGLNESNIVFKVINALEKTDKKLTLGA